MSYENYESSAKTLKGSNQLNNHVNIKADLLDVQDECWENGRFVSIEQLLSQQSDVTDELLLDLIWNEKVWRGKLLPEQEEAYYQQEYCRRFPALSAQIDREFEFAQTINESFGGQGISEFEQTEQLDENGIRMPQIPNHHVIEEFSSGAFGIIYRAQQMIPDREVAIKVVDQRSLIEMSTQGFHQEAQRIAELRHRNIIEIFTVGLWQGSPYFTMPFVKGGSLLTRIKDFSNRFREIAELLIPIAQAIEYARQLGVFHCDIKPSNILLDGDRPMVVDFGLAISPSKDLAMVTGGTKPYMAPEQFSGSDLPLSSQTDVYGLGALLYHLLTGRPPGSSGKWAMAIRPRMNNRRIPRDLSERRKSGVTCWFRHLMMGGGDSPWPRANSISQME